MEGETKFTFGKYDGFSIEYVYEHDKTYLNWVTDQTWIEVRFPELYAAIVDYLNEND